MMHVHIIRFLLILISDAYTLQSLLTTSLCRFLSSLCSLIEVFLKFAYYPARSFAQLCKPGRFDPGFVWCSQADDGKKDKPG